MKNIKLLVVEDDAMMAFLHKELIKKNNLCPNPISFSNGKEALEFLLSDPARGALYFILLDLNMPVMNGWEFLDELEKREISTRTTVAIVTSSIDRADKKKAEHYDTVNYYLTKPLLDFSPITLAVDQLKERINGGEYKS